MKVHKLVGMCIHKNVLKKQSKNKDISCNIALFTLCQSIMFNRLYLHIPFCFQKCGYCSFFSLPVSDDALNTYCAVLFRELELVAAGADCRRLESIYFGGGTPSLLKPGQLAGVLGEIDRRFGILSGAEITVEANPGTVDIHSLRNYHDCGVNRISLGVQSFDDRMLQRLGRIHTASQACKAVDAVHAAGFDNLGIDLMHGLPGQTLHDWQRELQQAVALLPEHISVYGLTVEEGTPFYERYGEDSPELPDDELSAQMFEMSDELLTQGGFEHYEIANYARPGFRSQHNSGYWKRDGYLGIGAGAHSFMKSGNGIRFSNIATLEKYQSIIEQGNLPRHQYVTLNRADAMAEFMFLGLRLSDGISYQSFFEEFGISVQKTYGKEISRLMSAGLLVEHDDVVCLTKRGALLSNQVFSSFIQG